MTTVTGHHHCHRCQSFISVPLTLPPGTPLLEVGLRVREISAASRDVHEVSTHLDAAVAS